MTNLEACDGSRLLMRFESKCLILQSWVGLDFVATLLLWRIDSRRLVDLHYYERELLVASGISPTRMGLSHRLNLKAIPILNLS